jgi:hypothetical protein
LDFWETSAILREVFGTRATAFVDWGHPRDVEGDLVFG